MCSRPLWETKVTSPPPLALLLRKLETHSTLCEADRQAILALPFTRKILEPQSHIVREGDVPKNCSILLSGFAYRHKLTGDGSRQIVALHIPGESLDFQNLYLDVSDHNVQTLTRAEVAIISRADFQNLALLRPAIAHAIMTSILVEASVFREWVLNVGRREAPARIAHLLCEFGTRSQAAGLSVCGRFELPMTQEQLADATGMTPVHVNRTLQYLGAEGLIQRKMRSIYVVDWQRLKRMAGFHEAYLHEARVAAA